MSLSVIGASFGRTGTKSLQIALETLGFGKCYHMESLLRSPLDIIYWNRANKKRNSWNKLLKGHQSIVDFPGCFFYEELYNHYPGSKVILSIRDIEDWYDSIYSTIFKFSIGPRLLLKMLIKVKHRKTAIHFLQIERFMKTMLWEEAFEGKFKDKQYSISKYQEHIDGVKARIPEEDLLLFNPMSGWKPLCEFLDVAEPNIPFPNVNPRKSFRPWVRSIIAETLNEQSEQH